MRVQDVVGRVRIERRSYFILLVSRVELVVNIRVKQSNTIITIASVNCIMMEFVNLSSHKTKLHVQVDKSQGLLKLLYT